MLVAFGSVFLTSLIAGLSGSDTKEAITKGFFGGLIYGFVLTFLYWKFSIGIYGPTPFLFSIIIGGFLGGWLSGDFEEITWPGFFLAIIYIAYAIFFAGLINTSDMFNSAQKSELIGEVDIVTDLESVLEPADPTHICLVSEDMAKVKANAALSRFKVSGDIVAGSRYSIGDGTKQYVDGQLWWVFPVEFQTYFKWKQDRQVPGYLRVSAENPFSDAQAVQVNKEGSAIHIKYLNSAYFENNAERYLRKNGYMNVLLDDWTFEPDDNWDPHYTVSTLERTTGYTGWALTGVVDLNLQTGDINLYKVDEIPSWIDRGIPVDVLDHQISKWGEYANATWSYTVFHNDKSQKPTNGWYMTYSGENCQWFSGFTSFNEGDQALTGFTLSDAKTGKTKFFKASGVTERIAYATAKSMWSNFDGYEPTELVPYNIYGQITYVIPITYQGQFKGVSLVSLRNKDISAMGKTLEKALNNYRAAMAKSKNGNFAPAGGELTTMTLAGKIARVGTPILDGEQQAFPFTITGEAKIFQAVYSYSTPKVLFMEPGDEVVLTYISTGEKVITCETFDIPSIVINDESPVQARYMENQKIVSKELNRIDEQEQRSKLLESDELKNVDPEALKKFLRSQKKE
ncbi:MAG: hypothetical protein ACKKL6_00190 [Candidatus Komeilibacteria bacterium]